MSRRLGLTRNAAPMLKTVGGKQHASDENHEPGLGLLRRKPRAQHIEKTDKVYPSPATTASMNSSQARPIEIGSDDDPISEDDDPAGMAVWEELADVKKPVTTSIEVVKGKGSPTEKKAGVQSSQQTKRLSSPLDEDGEPEWVSSQPASKRRKINVIPPRSSHGSSASAGHSKKSAAGYDKASQRRADRQSKDEEKKQQKANSSFRTAKGVEFEDEEPPAASFKAPRTNIFDLMAIDTEKSPTLGAARSDLDDLESLSDLDEKVVSAIEEGKQYLPSPKSYVSTHKCEHCGEEVEKLLYEEFVDDYNSGKELNIKWQRRFCDFHNRRKAEALWQERGYPTIEWSGLERRMRKHDNFLRQILRNEQESVHRKQLQKQLAPGRRSKNIGQMMNNQNVKAGTLVGYYGPRGQKAMVDHIIDNLSNDIREQAVHDDIVMTSGAQGGVSGFVQSVLVPHLAEMLIKEDGYLTVDWEAEVRDIVAESGELGELMNPETEDEIKEVDGDE